MSTAEEFRTKWQEILDSDRIDLLEKVLINLIVEQVQAVEMIDIYEENEADELGLSDDEVRFLFETMTHPQTERDIREALF